MPEIERYQPEDFYTDSPPRRTMGAECEYAIDQSAHATINSRGETVEPAVDICISHAAIAKAGYRGFKQFNNSPYDASSMLNNGGRLYADNKMAEYASAESPGPIQATKADLAGRVVVAKVVAASHIPVKGIYRRSGMSVEPGSYETSGYHSNALIPTGLFDDERVRKIYAGWLATKLWAGGGIVSDAGYQWSQKANGIGAVMSDGSTTEHGYKPMYRIRSFGHFDQWQRLETRLADPLQSPLGRYAAFATDSLMLRLLEARAIISLDTDMFPVHPIHASRYLSNDSSLRATYETIGGKQASWIDLQYHILDKASRLARKAALPKDEIISLRLFEEILDAYSRIIDDPDDLQPAAMLTDGAAKLYDLRRRHERIANNVAACVRDDMEWDRVNGKGMAFWERATPLHPLGRRFSTQAIGYYAVRPPEHSPAQDRVGHINDPTIEIIEMDWNEVSYTVPDEDSTTTYYDSFDPAPTRQLFVVRH